jgi:very-short-patch-repair endonuclease
VVIEVDGRVHDYRTDHDRLRTFIINQLGIQVVRFRNAEIETDLPTVLKRLRQLVSLSR